jgi:hypothetical protein
MLAKTFAHSNGSGPSLRPGGYGTHDAGQLAQQALSLLYRAAHHLGGGQDFVDQA